MPLLLGEEDVQRVLTMEDCVTIRAEREPWMNATNETSLQRFDVIPHHHSLADVLLGKAPGRESAEENNYYLSEGTGVQFAAVSAIAYQRACELGVGQPMPDEWARWFESDRDVLRPGSIR